MSNNKMIMKAALTREPADTATARLRPIWRAVLTVLSIAGAGASASPALALSACYADAVGSWHGPVLNGPGVQGMTTTFSLGADGRLVGRYHIEDAMPLDGELTDFSETGLCTADFRWRDRDGSGLVHIRFQPELGRFLGRWGPAQPVPGYVFNGYRLRPPPVS